MQTQRVLTNTDRRRFGKFLINPDTRGIGSVRARVDLEIKVEDAIAVQDDVVPPSLVTMNSTVELIDVATRKYFICTLVYADDSVLFPENVGMLQKPAAC